MPRSPSVIGSSPIGGATKLSITTIQLWICLSFLKYRIYSYFRFCRRTRTKIQSLLFSSTPYASIKELLSSRMCLQGRIRSRIAAEITSIFGSTLKCRPLSVASLPFSGVITQQFGHWLWLLAARVCR